MQCPNCHFVLPEGARQCPTCGLTFVVQNEGVSQAQVLMNGLPTGNSYVRQEYDKSQAPYVRNNLVPAILSTLFCCLPTGIYAIIQASRVQGLIEQGRIEEARQAAKRARDWAAYGVLAVLLYIIIAAFCGILSKS